MVKESARLSLTKLLDKHKNKEKMLLKDLMERECRKNELWDKLNQIEKVMKENGGKFYPSPKPFNHCPNCLSRLTVESVSICSCKGRRAILRECHYCGYVYYSMRGICWGHGGYGEL